MDAHAELEQLLADLFDGPPDASRNERLDTLLRAHPELQGEYLDHLQLHALLHWRTGKVGPAGHVAPPPEKAWPARAPIGSAASPWRARRRLVLALFALAASALVLVFLYTPTAQAHQDLVKRLIDLNLDLTQVHTREERDRIYSQQAPVLQARLAKAELPFEDRELAEKLLETSSWLTTNDDPVAEADRFNDLAEMVLTRIDPAANPHGELEILQLTDAYRRLTELGVDANLERAMSSGRLDADKSQKLERTHVRRHNRWRRFVEIVDRHPEASRKAIRRTMKTHFHKMKKLQKDDLSQ